MTNDGFSRRLSRAVLLAIPVAALALAVLVSASASARPTRSKPKPTVVLVHGAFADASSWDGVIARLQKDGYSVLAPANPLRSLSGDSAYIASVLKSVKGPIVLVGHSYGGAVITNAAAGNANVKALVYIAAYAPDVGESTLDLTGKFPGSQVASALITRPFPLGDGTTGTDLYLDPAKYRRLFTGLQVSAALASAMAAAERPITLAANAEKSQAAAWKTIPSWDLVAEDDKVIPPAAERFMARRARAHTIAIHAAHAAMLAHASAVTGLILDAARATG